ncbi:NAD(P)-dependent alcohol dehydrogenase [Demequina mangrovi]|uniref:NADPH:quinone reductase n=1 Tax=Demequina mangrovi TaxID=1043493 RepID=A0A1H6V635_9MICO|nr:NAD(P)-dependent alcohol dehydrogenase [Demequina mangrovi]SEI95685.1 NADPH:quinone reductase [Demequina mangrovi]
MTASTTAQAAAAASAATIAAAASTGDTMTATESTATMRAAVQRRYGGPEHLHVDTVEAPTPGPGEVLIEVRAGGVDRGVWHLMTGRPLLIRVIGFGFRRPGQPIAGEDVSGVVIGIGAGVTRFSLGDEVLGAATGSYAEHAIAKEDRLVRKPASLSFEEAAAVPVSGVAALRTVERAGIQEGQRVLVLGASGGVGSYALQLAVAAGATVTGVASAAKADLVRDLGATDVIDYRSTDVTSLDAEYDVIIDTGGLTPLRRLRRILSPTGTLVIVGGEGGDSITGGSTRALFAPLASLFTRQTLSGLMSVTAAEPLEKLVARIVAGDVRPALTRTYALADASTAIADLAAGRIAGKAVVRVRDAG